MSYLVLARKWRPQTFDDVLSQKLITDTLKNAISNERIAHSYLFSGPRGVGKTTTARILAKALNCQNADKPTPTPCNECSSCIEITQSRSPDVLEMDGASNRSVEDIQPIRESVQYAPQNRYKVIIIDEVHMLTNHAFNALLKTLEEPPPNVVFVFATTEPEKIPATIISRCQRHDFRRIPTDKIKSRLMFLAEPENINLTEDAAELIALKADGALRDGLSLFDQIIAYAKDDEIDRETAAQILGILPRVVFVKLATFAVTSQLKEMLAELHKTIETGISPNNLMEGLIDGYRETMLEKLQGISSPEKIEILSKYDIEDYTRIIRILSETVQKMKYSKRPSYLLEETMLYIGMMHKTTQLKSILSQLPDVQVKEPEPIKVIVPEGYKVANYKNAGIKQAPAEQPASAQNKKGSFDCLLDSIANKFDPEILDKIELKESDSVIIATISDSEELDIDTMDNLEQALNLAINEFYGNGYPLKMNFPKTQATIKKDTIEKNTENVKVVENNNVDDDSDAEEIENVLELFDAKPLD